MSAERYIIDTGDPQRDTLFAGYGSTLTLPLWDYVRNDRKIPITIEPVKRNFSSSPPVLVPDFATTDVFEFAIGKADQAPSSGTFKLTAAGSSTGLTTIQYNAVAADFAAALSAAMVAGGYSACTVTDLGTGTFDVQATANGVIPTGVIVSDAALLRPSCDVIVSEVSLGGVSAKYEIVISVRQAPVVFALLNTLIGAATVTDTITQAQDATHFAIETISFSDPPPISGTFYVTMYCLGVTLPLGPIAWDADAGTLAALLATHPKGTGNVSVAKGNNTFVVGFINQAGPKAITASSIANPTVITCASHGYTTGMTVTHSGTNSTPNTDGARVVTVIDANNYSVPVNVTVAGTAGVTRDATPPHITVANINLTGPQGVSGTINMNSVNLFKASLLETGESFSDFLLSITRLTVDGGQYTIYGPKSVTLSKDIVDVSTMVPVVFPVGPQVGKTVYVDSVYGNDATGQRQVFSLPFLTLTAAKAAASSGDLIIVGPGTYNEINLLKNGVNWYFEAGAVVQYTGNTACGIFDDSSIGANAAITCNITGNGRFVWSSTLVQHDPNRSGCVNITNSASVIYIEGDSVDVGSAVPDLATCLLLADGTTYARFRELTFGNGSNGIGLWWLKGIARVECEQVTGTGTGLPVYSTHAAGAPTGALFVKAQQITTGAYNAVQLNSLNASAQVWIEALEISCGAFYTVQITGGKNYITAQKISCTSNTFAAIDLQDGKLWVNAEKISGPALLFEGGLGFSGIEAYIKVQKLDEDTASTGSSILLAGDGTVTIDCDLLTTTAANGITISSATTVCYFSGRIDTSAAAAKNPILISANGTLRLRSAVLISNGARDSIETSGGAAPTVYSYGGWANNALDAAVSVIGDFRNDPTFT